MTRLFGANPWARIFADGIPDLQASIAFEHPYLDPVWLSIEDETVVARTTLVDDPLTMAFDIAGSLARLWPTWLLDLNIPLRVEIPQVPVLMAPATAMVFRAGTLDERLWLLECDYGVRRRS